MLREDSLMKFAILKHLIGLMVVLGFAASPRNVVGGDCPCATTATAQAAPQIADSGVVVDGRGYWQPGGYENRIGSPYYYSAPGADPYTYHFGPGFYRSGEYGHYRFPYYSYRRPWYYPGQPVYNRDTNLPW